MQYDFGSDVGADLGRLLRLLEDGQITIRTVKF